MPTSGASRARVLAIDIVGILLDRYQVIEERSPRVVHGGPEGRMWVGALTADDVDGFVPLEAIETMQSGGCAMGHRSHAW